MGGSKGLGGGGRLEGGALADARVVDQDVDAAEAGEHPTGRPSGTDPGGAKKSGFGTRTLRRDVLGPGAVGPGKRFCEYHLA